MDDPEPDVEPAVHAAGVGRESAGRRPLPSSSVSSTSVGAAPWPRPCRHAVQPALDHELAATGLGRVGRAALRHVADAAADLWGSRAGRRPRPMPRPPVGRRASRASAASSSCRPRWGRGSRRSRRPRPSRSTPRTASTVAFRALNVRRRSVRLDHRPTRAHRTVHHRSSPACPMLVGALAPFRIVGNICTVQIITRTGAAVKMDRDRRSTGSSEPFGESTSRARSSASPSPSGWACRSPTSTRSSCSSTRAPRPRAGSAEAMGLTTGAVTRVIDRLEQAGYVRRTTDPADRRRVVVEVVPERVATVESLLDSLGTAAAGRRRAVLGRAAGDDQRLPLADGRPHPDRGDAHPHRHPEHPSDPVGPSEYTAPLGGLASARLLFRAGAQDLRLRTGRPGDGPLSRPLRGRGAAGPCARRPRARAVPGHAVRLAQAHRHHGAQPVDPVGDRGRRRRQPRRGGPDRARPPPVRAHRRVRARSSSSSAGRTARSRSA